jgi:hypothetical protein
VKHITVGASDPARKVHDLGQDTLVVALASNADGTQVLDARAEVKNETH